LARGFGFPGYFGWNWDAVLDCLRDLDPGDGPYCLIVSRPDATFTAADEAAWETLLALVEQARDVWSQTGVQFRAVIA
jgi:hypothetical protein